MNYTTTPRHRAKRRRGLPPILLLMAAAIVLTALLSAVLLSLRSRPRAETVPDPHEGQVYINDGFNMVWLTPHEGVPLSLIHI